MPQELYIQGMWRIYRTLSKFYSRTLRSNLYSWFVFILHLTISICIDGSRKKLYALLSYMQFAYLPFFLIPTMADQKYKTMSILNIFFQWNQQLNLIKAHHLFDLLHLMIIFFYPTLKAAWISYQNTLSMVHIFSLHCILKWLLTAWHIICSQLFQNRKLFLWWFKWTFVFYKLILFIHLLLHRNVRWRQ